MFVGASALSVLTRSPGDVIMDGTISETVGFVLFLAFPIVGALVGSRRPRNPLG